MSFQPSTTPRSNLSLATNTNLPPAMTVSMSHDHYQQRALLIRLNNAAIDLLERYQKCRCCIDTLKEGLAIMKYPPHDSSNEMMEAARAAWARTEQKLLLVDASSEHGTESCTESSMGPLAHGADAHALPPANDLGVVVLSSRHDAEQAYHLLAARRTSKVCLTMDASDATLDLATVRSILVYNYGIAHRCCSMATSSSGITVQPQEPANSAVTTTSGNTSCNKLESFCLQIFQYAETLLPPMEQSASPTSHSQPEESPPQHNLLYRLVLTRNLMMLSCRLGLSLCEHYKETLDPIVADILGPLVQLQDVASNNGSNNDTQPGASAA